MDADFRIYIGYRATFEVQFSEALFGVDEDEIETIVRFLESDLVYTQLWTNKNKFTISAQGKMSKLE